MLKNRVKLPNRYDDEIYLEKISNKKYRLVYKFYISVGIIGDNYDKYSFVDPCGGPRISIGDKLEVGVVKSIYRDKNNYIVEIE